jgi:hypothetical protein
MNAAQTLIADYSCNTLRWNLDRKVAQDCIPEARKRPVSIQVPIWLFIGADGTRVRSRSPVKVQVTEEGPDEENPQSVFVFSCDRLHVFASGVSYKAAEDSFHDQVVHFFRSYRDLPEEELADDAAQIQALYKANFQESAPVG